MVISKSSSISTLARLTVPLCFLLLFQLQGHYTLLKTLHGTEKSITTGSLLLNTYLLKLSGSLI